MVIIELEGKLPWLLYQSTIATFNLYKNNPKFSIKYNDKDLFSQMRVGMSLILGPVGAFSSHGNDKCTRGK